LDAIFEKKFNKRLVENLMKELKEVYNKGFSSGFYLGLPAKDDISKQYGSEAVKKKIYIGKIINYYSNKKVMVVKVENGGLRIDDNILIIGNTTGVVKMKINSMEIDKNPINEIKKGLVGILVNKNVRKGDQVYLWK